MFVLYCTRKKIFDMASIIQVSTLTSWKIHIQKLLILFIFFYVLFNTISQIFKTYLAHRRAHLIFRNKILVNTQIMIFYRFPWKLKQCKILVKHPKYDFLPSSLEVEIINSLRIVYFFSFVIGRRYMIWKFTFISLLEILFGARDIIFRWSFLRKI